MGTFLADHGRIINAQEALPIPVELMTLLWENDNPSTAYTGGDVDLSSSDYDMLLWIFLLIRGDSRELSVICEKGKTVRLQMSNNNAQGVMSCTRDATRTSDVKYSVGHCYTAVGSTASTVDDNYCIPYKVYGFKLHVPLQSGNEDYVSRTNGGTFEGDITIDDANGTTEQEGFSVLSVGNSTPMGTNKNSTGIMDLYSDSGKKARVFASGDMADNRNIAIPDKSGTLALMGDVVSASSMYSHYIANQSSITISEGPSSIEEFHVFKQGGSPINAIYAISSAQSSATLIGGSSISGFSITKSGTNIIITNNSGAGCKMLCMLF